MKLIVGFHNFADSPTNCFRILWARIIIVREEEPNEKDGWMIQPIPSCRVGIGTPAIQPATSH